ncbi:MAG: hypothetical protein COW71_02030 [Ignavibacteriales bacterium CG18_big_fil_WC_8_21_14_2_50_31_20]|nr:hypothetical protein [Ignavibacteria bacterium]OIO23472.1 MAG: hypothetical protein AUJ54_01530 [Ignavibacteria bacterium CG1_02_37_35]PIQ10745.1 MAG: hypothetical protein COW71_02030 [Ignavibacteriales bacterium CG18_big_fil_WC_8_21_14_2_50_31_20]
MQSIQAIIEPNGHIRFPGKFRIKKPTKAIITFLEEENELRFTELVSEKSLAEDWNKSEEDEAWVHLQAAL